jgi:hypothetical protein
MFVIYIYLALYSYWYLLGMFRRSLTETDTIYQRQAVKADYKFDIVSSIVTSILYTRYSVVQVYVTSR